MCQLDLFPPMEEGNQFTLFPVPEKEMRGFDISALHKQPPKRQQLLPAAFENECKECEQKMKPMPCSWWTRRRPYATFYCEGCGLYLYIFVALPKPLLVWSDKISGIINISDFIEKLIVQRNHKNKLRALRAGGIPPP